MAHKRPPKVAIKRHNETLGKFRHKVKALKTILSDGQLDRFPRRTSISSFISWNDHELCVSPISRNAFYDSNHDEYISLRKQTERLLHQIKLERNTSKKRSDTLSALRRKLRAAESKAQEYVNQYTCAMAKLTAANDEIDRLNSRLRRSIARQARIQPLHKV